LSFTEIVLTRLVHKLSGEDQATVDEKPKKKGGRSQSRHMSKKSSPSKMEMDAEGRS
jgi:hypothetical protein